MKSVGYVFLLIIGSAFSEGDGEICTSDDEFSDTCINPCQPTCSRPTPPLSSPLCHIKICIHGCVCQPHLLRDTQSGDCISPSDCPDEQLSVPTCDGDNEEFNSCASFCPKTCQGLCKNNLTKCISACDERCDCKFGFIRDVISSKCVNPAYCPRCKCGQNEVWSQCKEGCQETCYTLKHPQNCIPIETVCYPGCVCEHGHVVNEKTGTCVRRDKCPP